MLLSKKNLTCRPLAYEMRYIGGLPMAQHCKSGLSLLNLVYTIKRALSDRLGYLLCSKT